MTQRIIIHRNNERIEVDIPKKWKLRSLIDNYCTKNYPGWDDWEWITDHVYTEEDANLIAAAPLMLETLKNLKAVGGLGLQNHEYIRKAIDVAEGRI